jgi:hypothetical protein
MPELSLIIIARFLTAAEATRGIKAATAPFGVLLGALIVETARRLSQEYQE